MAGVRKLCLARMRLAQSRQLAGSGNGKKGQIGIIRNIGDPAGDPTHSQLLSPCLKKNMGRSHARKTAAPGNDRPDHTTGAAGDELIA